MTYVTTRRGWMKGAATATLMMGVAGRAVAASTVAEPFRGLFPIGSTPVDGSDRIQYDQLAEQVTFLQRGRVPGIAWPQIASGWTTLTQEERITGAEALVNVAKGGSTAVILGVQSPDPAEVERYCRHADRIGADGIICIPPTDITDDAGLLAYYQRVGQYTSLPLFVQAVGEMSVDLMVRMAETVPTFRYLKDESGEPLERVAELLSRTGGRVHDFSGRGANLMITEMERGFAGACPFVTLADVYQACWEAWHAGDHEQAFTIFGAIQASNTMFAQSTAEALIARGVFKPGTLLRAAPAAPGSGTGRWYPATTAPEIRRVLGTYMKPYLRA